MEKSNLFGILLVIILGIVVFTWTTSRKDGYITQYLGNYDYTIGKVEQHYEGSGSNNHSATYIYSVNGVVYKKRHIS